VIKESVLMKALLLMFLTFFSGCYSDNENNKKLEEKDMSLITSKDNEIKPVKLAISPIGMASNTYFFELSSDGIIEAKVGIRRSIDIEDANFIEPSESMNKKLSTPEQESIVKLVEEIEKDKTVLEKALRKGGWEVIISIDNNKYNFNYGDYMDISYGKLVKLMIEYSPLEVDIHGWS